MKTQPLQYAVLDEYWVNNPPWIELSIFAHNSDGTIAGGNLISNGRAQVSSARSANQGTNDADLSFGVVDAADNGKVVYGWCSFDAEVGGNALWRGYLGTAARRYLLDHGDDTFYVDDNPFEDDDVLMVMFDLTPGGFGESTSYYVINKSGDSFQLSASQGGASITPGGSSAGILTKIAPLTLVTGQELVILNNALHIIEE